MSETPGTFVFLLNSALGVSLSGDSWPETLDLSASQTCFAVSGSYADTRNLSQRWRSQAGDFHRSHELGIGRGNPRVFKWYPYPYPLKPLPLSKGEGFGRVRVRVPQGMRGMKYP
jgi:hypothetical protein